MSKVVEYVGWMHTLKDRVKESWTQYWSSSGSEEGSEEKETNFREKVKDKLEKLTQRTIRRINHSSNTQDGDFSHLTRTKTRAELVRISAAVMGIEFSYAAETAFVSPLLLNIGLRHRHMTLMWCLSPLLGFFVTPLLGSLSDGCHSKLGKRRPFIILLSIGIILGLILVPNGQTIGRLLGDTYKDNSVAFTKPGAGAGATSNPPRSRLDSDRSARRPTTTTTSFPFPDRLNFTSREEEQELKQRSSSSSSNLTISSFNNKRRPLQNFNPIEHDPGNPNSPRRTRINNSPPSYKHGSQYLQLLDDSGRRGNSMGHGDEETELQDTLKKFKLSALKTNKNSEADGETTDETKSHSLDNLFNEAVLEMDQNGNESSTSDPTPSNSQAGQDEDVFKSWSDSVTNSPSPALTRSSDILGPSPAPAPDGLRATEPDADNSNSNMNDNDEDEEEEDGDDQDPYQDPPKDGDGENRTEENDSIANHPWGLIFTVIGTVLLDFDADACQSPSRAYMLDITIPEDHARGLSTFTIMAGLGGSMGYCLGALNWENTFIGTFFGGQVRAVFTLVLFIFIGCVITTLRSFQEIPIDRLYQPQKPSDGAESGRRKYSRFEEENDYEETTSSNPAPSGYGAIGSVQETSFSENMAKNNERKAAVGVGFGVGGIEEGTPAPVTAGAELSEAPSPTFREYVKTIVQMPKSLQWLCLTNYFCWMSLVCYSLYFTDFVGEAVFHGDPTAPLGSTSRTNYEEGVRFGCWGMSLYSLSCSIYSLSIDTLVQRFGAKRVYIYGQLVYSVGMIFMGIFRHRAGVIIFSWTAGIMYATLFTMPYLLVARYHAAETFDIDVDDLVQKPSQKRGLGTDVAIVSSMVFLAQMTQALTLGPVVSFVGSPTAIVFAAAVFASCGAVVATRVLYLDL